MDGARRSVGELPAAPAGPVADPDGLAEPPAYLGLNEAEAEAWRALAPHGLKERTLTVSRAPGFAKLCLYWARCAAFKKRIDEVGTVTAEAARLLGQHEKWEKLLKASLGEYNLRSFGKPATPEKPKAAVANPFAAVSGR